MQSSVAFRPPCTFFGPVPAPGIAFPNSMHIPRWFIWLLLYAAATFAWIVFFEHGQDNFREGARREWDRLWNAATEWISRVRTP